MRDLHKISVNLYTIMIIGQIYIKLTTSTGLSSQFEENNFVRLLVELCVSSIFQIFYTTKSYGLFPLLFPKVHKGGLVAQP